MAIICIKIPRLLLNSDSVLSKSTTIIGLQPNFSFNDKLAWHKLDIFPKTTVSCSSNSSSKYSHPEEWHTKPKLTSRFMNKFSFKCHQTIKISVVFTYPTFSFSCCQVSDDKQSSVGHEDLHFLLPIVHHFHCSLVSAKTIQDNISLNFVTEPKHSTFHFCSVQFKVKFKSLWHEVI